MQCLVAAVQFVGVVACLAQQPTEDMKPVTAIKWGKVSDGLALSIQTSKATAEAPLLLLRETVTPERKLLVLPTTNFTIGERIVLVIIDRNVGRDRLYFSLDHYHFSLTGPNGEAAKPLPVPLNEWGIGKGGGMTPGGAYYAVRELSQLFDVSQSGTYKLVVTATAQSGPSRKPPGKAIPLRDVRATSNMIEFQVVDKKP